MSEQTHPIRPKTLITLSNILNQAAGGIVTTYLDALGVDVEAAVIRVTGAEIVIGKAVTGPGGQVQFVPNTVEEKSDPA